MPTQDLRIRISLDEAGNIKAQLAGISGGFKNVDRDVSLAGRGIKSLTGLVGGLQGALAGVGAGLVLKRVIDETASAERGQRLLEQAIKSTGGAAGVTVSDVEKLADSLSRAAGVDDDDIIAFSTSLIRLGGISGEVLPRVAQNALDVSAALGTDAADAAETLGRALQRPEQAARKLLAINVSLTASERALVTALEDANRTAEAQDVILRAVERSYGGAAAAARNTLGGALGALQTAAGNLLETDGLPGVAKSINAIADTLNDPANQAAADAFFGTILTLAAKTIEEVTRLGGKLRGLIPGGEPGETPEPAPGETSGDFAAAGLVIGGVGGAVLGARAGRPVAGGVAGAALGASLGDRAEGAINDFFDPLRGIRGDQGAVASALSDAESFISTLPPGSRDAFRPKVALLEEERQRILRERAARRSTPLGGIPLASAIGPGADDFARFPERLLGAETTFPPLLAGLPRESTQRFSGLGTPDDPIRNLPDAAPTGFLAELQKSLDNIKFETSIAGFSDLEKAVAKAEERARDLGEKGKHSLADIEEGARLAGEAERELFQAERAADFANELERAKEAAGDFRFVGPTAELDKANAAIDRMVANFEITAGEAEKLKKANEEIFDERELAKTEGVFKGLAVSLDQNAEAASAFGGTIHNELARANADTEAYGSAIQNLIARGYSAASDEVQELVEGQRQAKEEAAGLAAEIERQAQAARAAAEETARVEANIQKLIRGTTGRSFTIGIDTASIKEQVDSALGIGPSRSDELFAQVDELRQLSDDLRKRFGSEGNPFQGELNRQSAEVDAQIERLVREANAERAREIQASRDEDRRNTGVLAGRIDKTNATLGAISGGIDRLGRSQDTVATETRRFRESMARGDFAVGGSSMAASSFRTGFGSQGWRK